MRSISIPFGALQFAYVIFKFTYELARGEATASYEVSRLRRCSSISIENHCLSDVQCINDHIKKCFDPGGLDGWLHPGISLGSYSYLRQVEARLV
jgi:hypothetical protein